MQNIDNPPLQLAFDFVQYTDKNIFLTGKAGTGKTTFLQTLKKNSPKRMVVVAPTGVAAINAGGVTIHSFFQMPFGPHLPNDPMNPGGNVTVRKFNREKRNIIKSLDLVIIDEISMVRADLLDGIDDVLKRYRNSSLPFGGVQLLMIGDLHQLPPIVKDEEWELLKEYYYTYFFFASKVLNQIDYVKIELKHIYRQKDTAFIDILNKIRDNRLDADSLKQLNTRCNPSFNPSEKEGYITLTTHNAQAQAINNRKLKELPSRSYRFKAKTKGDFPEYAYPTEDKLTLKQGTQVMFVKNDTSQEKQYYNGKIGRVTGFREDKIVVQCTGDEYPILVKKVEWQNMKYAIDPETKEIKENIAGTFEQYPLKMAWAITIHKSQGLTFEKAIIDAQAAFAFGQVYVALSRLKTIEGLVLSTPITPQGIKSNSAVDQFVREIYQNPPSMAQFKEARKAYQKMLLLSLFDFNSIQKRLYYCRKLFREHKNSLPVSFEKELSDIITAQNHEIVDVSLKFHNQLNQMISITENIEENLQLKERIRKACPYFMDKLNVLINTPLAEITVETDNKVIRKAFDDAFERLDNDLHLKMECLKACQNGFWVKTYMKAKASAVIEKSVAKKKKRDKKIQKDSLYASDKLDHPILFNRLRAWRSDIAKEEDIPHFMILHQKTAAEISTILPQTRSALKVISGIGKMKLKKYGDDIIKIVNDYCTEKKIDAPESVNKKSVSAEPSDHSDPDKPQKKPNTRELSLTLFNQGHSAEEIAAKRELHIRTIEDHLAFFVGTGELKLEKLLPPEKEAMISKCFLENNSHFLKPVKESLGEDVSYSELRYVQKYLEYSGQLKINTEI